MALDPSLILGGNGLDAMGAITRGRETAFRQAERDRQNALAMTVQQNGAGLVRGDQSAVNALAAYDPQSAMQFQDAAFDRDAAKAEARRKAEEYARQNGADALAASMERTARVAKGAAFFYQNGDEAGYNNYLISQGVDPKQFPMAYLPAFLAQHEGGVEALKAFAPPEPPKPQTTLGKLQADLRAGLITPEQYQIGIAGETPRNTTTTVDPATGQMTIVQGAAATSGSGATIGQVYNPNEIDSVLGMIREIKGDPALDSVVGSIEGGGGNNIDDMGLLRRGYYGGKGLALIEKIGQLQSNAWLSARQMLKGGGAITDYESRKAEGAVARLSRAKSEQEFRGALDDLQSAIIQGAQKLNVPISSIGPIQPSQGAAAPAPSAPMGAPDLGLSEDDLRYLGVQ